MQSKVFRLFISSTFSDFKKERSVLQSKVFPTIKKYASKLGYTFQPIDLRWGVNHEAQLDQKTLALCLSEVQACKTHIHPNFLIMTGDRYGWIPSPYAIEKGEFEEILSHVKEHKELLKEWYKLDNNQLPPSYILKERAEPYTDADTWIEVENTLRETLQKAVNHSTLSEEQKRRYFLSATEAEVEEGIISYIKPTKFQEEVLLKNDKELLSVDQKYIFGLLRDIDKSTKIEDKFINTDYNQAQEFKKRVQKSLLEKNTLHVKTVQTDKESLDEEYLKEFQTSITAFLKQQIERQKQTEVTIDLTPLEVEQQAQERYAKDKRELFLGQDEPLKVISDYITDTNQSPLVIYGKSGRGKSSLLSKAIEQTQATSSSKLIYRFVGATPESASSVGLLTSIFEELGVNIEVQQKTQQEDKKESFEEFSLRVHSEFLNLKESIVIFIDAIDQLNNTDSFLWLPNTLPSNLKIVISALEDKNYKEDTKYFEAVKTKTKNISQIPEFNKEKELLKILLKKEDRAVDDNQRDYFLKQYQTTKSPLYVTIAAREMKSWKSAEKTQTLKETQKEIIKEFIDNLAQKYHHNKEFVQKVVGYIYASKDGLSESELLQLLSTDKEFIEKMAPSTYHENLDNELPLVHWSRLQTELQLFFSKKTQDNEELIYFFHREFEDAIKNQPNQQEQHEAIIKATQKMILKSQDEDFHQNRWGKLYATLLAEYELRYKQKRKQEEFSYFLAKEELKESCVEKCYTNINDIGWYHHNRMEIKESISYLKINYFFTNKLYQKNPSVWAEPYTTSLNNLAISYKNNNQTKEAIELETKALEITEKLYQENPSVWAEDYTRSLNNLSVSYYKNSNIDESLKLLNKNHEVHTEMYGEDDTRTQEVLANIEIVKGGQDKSSGSDEDRDKTTFEDLLYLSKFISSKNEEDEISVLSFIVAFGFIEFGDRAKSIFSQIYNLEKIEEHEDAQMCLREAKKYPEKPYNEELKGLIILLKEMLGDESIGTLR